MMKWMFGPPNDSYMRTPDVCRICFFLSVWQQEILDIKLGISIENMFDTWFLFYESYVMLLVQNQNKPYVCEDMPSDAASLLEY